MLTKSRFKIAQECPRKLVYAADSRYVNAKSEDELLEALAEGGHQVGELAKLMHPGGVEISAASIEEQVRETDRLLQQEEITLFEPTFRHENLVARVDVLVKRRREVQLIEVKAKGFNTATDFFRGNQNSIASEWRPYLYDVAFQTLVIERTHPEWEVTPFLMLLDTSARATADGIGAQFRVERNGRRVHVTVRQGFDPGKLKTPLLRSHDVTKEVRILRNQLVYTPAGSRGFEELVDWLATEVAFGRALPPYPGSECKRCEYYCAPGEVTEENRSGWAECMEMAFRRRVEWPRTATVFGLYNFRKVDALLGLKRLALVDVDESDVDIDEIPREISPSHRHGLQIEEAKGTGEKVHLERDTLRRAFGEWQFPLHFIDFETARPALPFNADRRPHDLLLFQFSHHVFGEDGRLRHASECLIADPGVAPSIAVVRALGAALSGDSGTVVHWWHHERTVLSEIQKQIGASNEHDREELAAFINTLIGNGTVRGRLADLGRLVLRTAFFQGTDGRSSIKKVLPAVLARSDWLWQRYGRPVYGTDEITSLNFPPGWTWLREQNGQVRDPYELLDPVLLDDEVRRAVEQGEDEDTGLRSFIANGGAAMVAYAQLQNPDLPHNERQRIKTQLKRYCELDTLAMVMVYEAIEQWLA
ncbi:MAG: DUF2779 domain-containing protein [Gammaproteobacteria bacterium]